MSFKNINRKWLTQSRIFNLKFLLGKWAVYSHFLSFLHHLLLSPIPNPYPPGQPGLWHQSFIYRLLTSLQSSRIFQTGLRGFNFIFLPLTISLILCTYCVIVPYSFLPPVTFAGVTIPIFNLIPPGLIGLGLINRFFHLRSYYGRALSVIFVIWGLWLGLSFLSALQTQPLPLSLFKWLTFEFTGSLVFILIYTALYDQSHYRVLGTGLIVVVSWVAIYGIWVHFRGEPGWFISLWEQRLKVDPAMSRIYDHFSPSSAFGNSSMRGSLIVSILPGLIYYLIHSFQRITVPARIITGTLIIVFLWGLYLCQTTGPYITLILMGIGIFIYQSGSRFRTWYDHSNKILGLIALIIMVVFVVAILILPDFDIQHRKLQIKIGSHILAGTPLLGVGTGNYPLYADHYATWYAPLLPGGNYYNVADNYGVTFIVERGLAGVLLAGYILYRLIKRGFMTRAFQILNHPIDYVVVMICPTIIINGLFWDNGNHLTFRVIFFICAALSLRAIQERSILR